MKRIEPKEVEAIEKVIDTLFSIHPIRPETDTTNGPTDEIPLFSEGELIAKMLKTVTVQRPELLLEMYNQSLEQGVFSSRWKRARLALIEKSKG